MHVIICNLTNVDSKEVLIWDIVNTGDWFLIPTTTCIKQQIYNWQIVVALCSFIQKFVSEVKENVKCIYILTPNPLKPGLTLLLLLCKDIACFCKNTL